MRYQDLIIITKVTVKSTEVFRKDFLSPLSHFEDNGLWIRWPLWGILMAARPTRILSYSRTIVFRKRTKVRRENAHLHALATWRARNTCDMRSLNAVAYFEESLLDHETWELSHPLPYRTCLLTNKLTFITHITFHARALHTGPYSSLLVFMKREISSNT